MDELDLYDDSYVIEADYDDFEEDTDEEDYDEADYDASEDMLEAIIGGYDESDAADLADFFWRKKRKKRRKAPRVTRAKGTTSRGSVLAGMKRDIKRNAIGIQQVNKRAASVSNRVSANSRVARIQNMQIAKINKLQKALGVLEFVQAYNPDTQELNTFQLLKGAVASGMLGTGKGTLHNPYLLGAVGLFLNNRNGSLGGLLGGNVN